jgi:hypothetical protein
MIKFQEQGHVYTSIVPDGIKWLGVTTLIGKLHEGFDSRSKAISSHNRKPSAAFPNKWYKVPVGEIEAAWDSERERSTELGHWYHSKRENELYEPDMQLMWGVHRPVFEGADKIAPNQILTEGVYPEHLMYLLSAQICGQSDYVDVRDGKVRIRDYKTCKEIKRRGFSNYKGTKMMFSPIEHLEDCDYTHYNIQLSLYMYMILRHNPNLEPGEMTIEHIKFEEASRDKYDYPIYKKDESGQFIIREIEEIKMPYLRKEVVSILEWLKYNKANLLEQ